MGGQQRVRFGGFLDGVDAFDAGLFGITGAEADLMDPQHRVLMEVCTTEGPAIAASARFSSYAHATFSDDNSAGHYHL